MQHFNNPANVNKAVVLTAILKEHNITLEVKINHWNLKEVIIHCPNIGMGVYIANVATFNTFWSDADVITDCDIIAHLEDKFGIDLSAVKEVVPVVVNNTAVNTVIIEVLNHCVFNKSVYDFNLITDLVKVIKSGKVTSLDIKEGVTGIFISGFFGGSMLSVMFNDNNVIMITLPHDNMTTYTIVNDGYNAQYSEIKLSLSKYMRNLNNA